MRQRTNPRAVQNGNSTISLDDSISRLCCDSARDVRFAKSGKDCVNHKLSNKAVIKCDNS